MKSTIAAWAAVVACLGLIAIAALPARADSVLIGGFISNEAYEGGLSGSTTLASGGFTSGTLTSSPQTGSNAANRNATSHSRSAYSLSSSGFLFNNIDQQRPGNVVYAYNSSAISVQFSVTSDTLYTLSGSFPFSIPSANISYNLTDLDTADVLFDGYESSSKSFSTASGTFTVGGPQSGESYSLTGSLTGTLLASHSYKWTANAGLQLAPLPPSSDSGATSTGGSFDLQLTPVPPAIVPLPKTASAGIVLFAIVITLRLASTKRTAPLA